MKNGGSNWLRSLLGTYIGREETSAFFGIKS